MIEYGMLNINDYIFQVKKGRTSSRAIHISWAENEISKWTKVRRRHSIQHSKDKRRDAVPFVKMVAGTRLALQNENMSESDPDKNVNNICWFAFISVKCNASDLDDCFCFAKKNGKDT